MKLIIDGNVPSQKNNKEIAINRKTGQRFVRSNDRVTAWKETATESLRKQFEGYKVSGYPIGITLIFFFDNERRHDLDNAAAGVMDALAYGREIDFEGKPIKGTGVIVDDSVAFVDCLQLQYGGLDKINPRVEIYIDE